jgi:hypothetical protein
MKPAARAGPRVRSLGLSGGRVDINLYQCTNAVVQLRPYSHTKEKTSCCTESEACSSWPSCSYSGAVGCSPAAGARTTVLRLWVPLFVSLLLPVLGVACSVTPSCVEPASSETTAHRVGNAPRGGAELAAERTTDQGLARQVRRAIHADPGLVSAARAVAVTTDQGVVRLVGWVRTDKERSSIAFKAGQMARAGGVDDRVTVGNCVREAVR